MRDYAKISTTIWNSRKFRSLATDDARLLYFYLHTCQHVNSVGCFVLPDHYAMGDLGWTKDRYLKAMDSLSKAYLVAMDQAENLIRIIDFTKHDPFTNPKHAEGALRVAMSLPMTQETVHLFNDLLTSKHVSDKAKIEQKIKSFDSLSEPYRNPEPEPEPLPEPEKEEEDAQARGLNLDFSEADSAPQNLTAGFLDDLRQAVGVSAAEPPPFWQEPGLSAHVAAWITHHGLTQDQIIAAAKASRDRNPEAPDGPKALDRWMERAGVSVRTAGSITPGKGQRADTKPPPTPQERLAFYAEWVNNPAKVCPPSCISTQTAQALLAANLVSMETLRKRGIAA
jgi:hypothetical protein